MTPNRKKKIFHVVIVGVVVWISIIIKKMDYYVGKIIYLPTIVCTYITFLKVTILIIYNDIFKYFLE